MHFFSTLKGFSLSNNYYKRNTFYKKKLQMICAIFIMEGRPSEAPHCVQIFFVLLVRRKKLTFSFIPAA